MAFVNSLVSYFVLLLMFVATAGAAVFLGISLRKRANAKAAEADQTEASSEA